MPVSILAQDVLPSGAQDLGFVRLPWHSVHGAIWECSFDHFGGFAFQSFNIMSAEGSRSPRRPSGPVSLSEQEIEDIRGSPAFKQLLSSTIEQTFDRKLSAGVEAKLPKLIPTCMQPILEKNNALLVEQLGSAKIQEQLPDHSARFELFGSAGRCGHGGCRLRRCTCPTRG